MTNSASSKINYLTIGLLTAVVVAFFLWNLARVENVYEMWAFTAMLLCGGSLVVFLIVKPLEAILVYFALSPTLQMFNDVTLDVPGSAATLSFGGIILTVILIFGGISCFRKSSEASQENRAICILFLSLAIWMLVSTLSNIRDLDPLKSLKELGRITGVFVVFIIGLKYSRGVSDIMKFMVALFASLIVPIGFAIWQIIFGTKYVELEQFNRVMGTFGIPNMFGMYLILPLIVLTILSMGSHLRDIRLLFAWSSLPLLLTALFFTYTRASWLAFFLSAMYIAFRKYRRLIPITVVPALLILSLVSLESLRMGSTGLSGRIELWSTLAPVGLSSPIFGCGLMSMSMISKSVLGFSNQGQNQYLLYWIEGGFFGVVLFIALLVSLFRRFQEIYLQLADSLYKDLYLGYLAFLLGIYSIAFFESNAIFQIWVWLPAGVFLGSGHGIIKGQLPNSNVASLKRI